MLVTRLVSGRNKRDTKVKTTIQKATLRGATCLSAVAALYATGAYAQETPADEGGNGDVIIVTGSRIISPNLTASSPVSVVSGDTFKEFNSPSVETLLASNPQFLPESGPAVNNGNPGAASLNLRGLGDQRTLVLVNGKRMVSYDYNGVVDVNSIPTALIKRVDVLTGGASAVYGSDAVSGVVNFILDDEFTGLRFDGSTQITGHGDGPVYDANLTGGLKLGDRGNIVASVGYLKRKLIFQSQRKFSNFALDSDDLVSPGGSSTSVPTVFDNTFANTSEDYYQIGAGNNLVPYYQPYNYAPPNYLITPQERWLGTVLAKYEVADGIELYGRGSYIRSKVNSQSAPTGTFGYSFDIYPDNPYLTDQQRDLFFNGIGTINADGSTTVNIRRRIVESGGRTTTYDNESWQAVVGARGDFADKWNYDVFGQYSKTTRNIAYLNDITYARVAQALDAVQSGTNVVCRDPSNGCVPINLFTTDPIGQDALAFISASGSERDVTEQWVAGASVSGSIASISPWSDTDIGLALGVEYRKEKARADIDAAYASGDLIGYGQGIPFDPFSYDVKEAYGEVLLPIISDKPGFQELTLEAGARYSDYSSVGSVFTWKAGANWAPMDGIRLRGMFQRAVRAPNLYELAAPHVSSIDNLDTDPCAGNNPVGNAMLTALCVATGAPSSQIGRIPDPVSGQINSFSGGNLDLKAEKANTITLGVVLNPVSVPGLTMSVDYYDIKIKNAIDTLGGSPQNVVDACYNVIQDASSPYCQAIHRNALSGSLAGGIDYGVDQFQFNAASRQTRGVDVQFDYKRPVGAYTIGLNVAGNYIVTYKKQGASFLPETECAGRFGFACNFAPMPKWKHTATLSFGNDNFNLAGRWRLIGGVKEDSGTDILKSKIPSVSYFDFTGNFTIQDSYTLRLGIQNAFDKQPPIVGSAAGGTAYNAANTFPSVYDVLGRTFFVGITAKY
jgi:outer membrane receptor protein involved in Fe transport